MFEFREGLSGELGRGNATLSMGDDDGDDTVTVHGTKAQEFAEFEQAITFVSCQLPMTDGFSGTDREHPATVVWVFDRFDGRGLAGCLAGRFEVRKIGEFEDGVRADFFLFLAFDRYRLRFVRLLGFGLLLILLLGIMVQCLKGIVVEMSETGTVKPHDHFR